MFNVQFEGKKGDFYRRQLSDLIPSEGREKNIHICSVWALFWTIFKLYEKWNGFSVKIKYQMMSSPPAIIPPMLTSDFFKPANTFRFLFVILHPNSELTIVL